MANKKKRKTKDEGPIARERLAALREIVLANLVLTSEIPAPTFGEEARAHFILQRFSEAGLSGGSLDERGNAATEIPGEDPERRILVVAHTDTNHAETEDHSVSVLPDRLTGPGIADNAAGVAAMMTLPRILNTLGIRLQSTLVLLGAGRSLGQGNLEGLTFFLDHVKQPLSAGLCLEGAELGRLNHAAQGLLRGEIQCRIPRRYDWTRFGACDAIVAMNTIINGILAIPLPARPRTEIVIGQIQGGTGYNRTARSARLRFDVHSECDEQLAAVEQHIRTRVEEIKSLTRAEVSLDVVARRKPGGIPFDHPLVRDARAILDGLGVEPHIEPSSSELSAFTARNVPALTVGLTQAENIGELTETVFIDPFFTGLAQTVSLLQAIDREVCSDVS